jgi:hypothetical protein
MHSPRISAAAFGFSIEAIATPPKRKVAPEYAFVAMDS